MVFVFEEEWEIEDHEFFLKTAHRACGRHYHIDSANLHPLYKISLSSSKLVVRKEIDLYISISFFLHYFFKTNSAEVIWMLIAYGMS